MYAVIVNYYIILIHKHIKQRVIIMHIVPIL